MRDAARRMTPVFLLLTGFLAWSAQAQERPVPEDLRVFAAQYVAAMNAKDAARIRSMYHSKSLACITPQTKDFYDEAMAVQLSDRIPAGYMVSLLPVNEDNLRALADSQIFPVKPMMELHIDYQQGEESGTVILWLVRENGRWAGDFPCITDAALQQYRDSAASRREAEARYKALAAGIQPALRDELLTMLRKHQRSSAIQKYRDASGQDMPTAMYVVNELHQQLESR